MTDIGTFLLQQSGGFFTCVQIRCGCFYIHTTITVWTMESDVLIWGIKAVPPVTVLKRRKSGISNYTSPGFVVNRAVYMSAVKREYHKKYQPKRKSHSQLLCQSTDILRSSYWVVLKNLSLSLFHVNYNCKCSVRTVVNASHFLCIYGI